MASSISTFSAPPPKSSTSDIDDDVEMEYEEIKYDGEVESEEETVKEVKAEGAEDGKIDDFGEDLTPVRHENKENDTNQIMELEEHKERIQSIPVTQGISISNSRQDASREKDTAIVTVRGETNHTAVEVVDSIRQISPRLQVKKMRFSNPSSSAEYGRENKKLMIACKFHTKGWCIKGNSCRFLHIKDGLDAAVKDSEILERQASSSACIPPQRSGENFAVPLVKGSSTAGNSIYRGNFSGSSVTSHDNHQKSDGGHTDLRLVNLPYPVPAQHLSFGSSPWNTNALGMHSLLQSDKDHCAVGSESENLSQTKYQTKLSSCKWEPSVPFLPSHAITRNLLKEKLYDPICDSIGRADVRDGKFKFSYSDQGSSVKNVKVQTSTPQEEEKLLNSVHIGDTVEENILSSSCDNKVQFVKPKLNTDMKVEESSTNDENDADFKRENHMQTESKAFKYFQAALIEFVKELVRPTWQKGQLSKEAHKVIVKKTVDKVLGTFQPNQIPNTGELVKSYLSSSEPKLGKLVEAYIIKYGNS